MKLRDIINNVDKSESNSCSIEVDKILQDLIGNYLGNPEKDCEKLKAYFFAKSICTDTWVGWRAYFLDDEVVAISNQPYRKYDETFQWVSKEAANKTYEYLMSLYEADEPKGDVMDEGDLDRDFGKGYKVEFGENLLTKDVIYEPTGEKVLVTKTWGMRDGIKTSEDWSNVKITFKNGEEKKVSMTDIIIPFCIKENQHEH